MMPPVTNTKAVFYLKGKDAQQHGIRLILTSKLIERHFKRGSVWDDPNGIQTEVLMEGDKEKIEKFYEETREKLIDWINIRNQDIGVAQTISKNPGVDVTLSDLEFNENLSVHDLSVFGHSLTFDEVSKGYNVFLDNIKTNKELRETYRELQGTLNKLSNVLEKKL